MFGRTKDANDATTAAPATDEGTGKGRPTPTRRDAQAAYRDRAKAGVDKKASSKVQRQRRAEQNQKMREGMRAGDERYLMERDKGPLKRFVRDYVDSRVSFMEFLLPMLILIIILQASGIAALAVLSTTLWTVSIVLMLLDVVALDWRLGKQVKQRFGDSDQPTRGWRFYAFMRSIQLRPLRMPKPQRKWRETLPDRY